MAWVPVPNAPNWEYDDSATIADTYPDTPGTIVGGIRQFTLRRGTETSETLTYIKCRKITIPTATGELNKLYLDAHPLTP